MRSFPDAVIIIFGAPCGSPSVFGGCEKILKPPLYRPLDTLKLCFAYGQTEDPIKSLPVGKYTKERGVLKGDCDCNYAHSYPLKVMLLYY